MRAIEDAAIAGGESAGELMERAGAGMARRVRQLYPGASRAAVFLGRGNNGGDGLVAARHLMAEGWDVQLNFVYPLETLGALPSQKLRELQERFPAVDMVINDPVREFANRPQIALDAMVGIGSTGRLRDEPAAAVERLNRYRRYSNLQTIALDVPSGIVQLADETDPPHDALAVVADVTLAAGFPKDFLAREDLSHWVGRIEVVPLFSEEPAGSEELLTGPELATLLPRRSAHSHKGSYGRVAIVAGSEGMSGAPLLCARAAQRAGAGLVYLCVPDDIRAEVTSRCPPEIMVRGDEDWLTIENLDAIAVGPGIGVTEAGKITVETVIRSAPCPVVLDADALTLVAQNPKSLLQAKQPLVLTPHEREMERLTGKPVESAQRGHTAAEFAHQHNVILALKGARTVLALHGQPLFYNSTGNPGLARGGSGDALTGIIVALIANGLTAWNATQLGVWLHGKAADISLEQVGCAEGYSVTQAIDNIGLAIKELREN